MIATRFRSVYWVGGVAVAALGCYLVSQRVAAERANLSQVEMEIASSERQIRALETEIGTRAGMNQIERWNVEVLALSAPKAAQFMGSEVQLASLVRPSVPAMEAPAAVQLASANAPASTSSQITRVSYQTSLPTVEQDEQVPARVVRASYTASAPAKRAERTERPAEPRQAARKAEAPRPSKPERTAKSEAASRTNAKPERSAKREDKAAAPAKSAKRDADRKAAPERTAKRDGKAQPDRNVKRVANRKADDNTPRVRPAIYVKPVTKHQSVALLDDRLMGDLGRLAASERTGGKRNR